MAPVGQVEDEEGHGEDHQGLTVNLRRNTLFLVLMLSWQLSSHLFLVPPHELLRRLLVASPSPVASPSAPPTPTPRAGAPPTRRGHVRREPAAAHGDARAGGGGGGGQRCAEPAAVAAARGGGETEGAAAVREGGAALRVLKGMEKKG